MKRMTVLLFMLSACAPAARPVQQPASSAPAPTPKEIHWSRNAAEHDALFIQAYHAASERVREASAGLQAGTWGVILDADETVLDNSPYQLRRARLDSAFTNESWNAWVREGAATALPGASEFIRLVRQLGGRAVIVTNRDEEVCPETRANLTEVGVQADLVLCKPPGGSDKNPRFQAVAQGTASTDLPALQVVAYVGDNIQDFPGLTQAVRNGGADAFELFGRTYFILPNPMYGSWERNEEE